MSSNNVRHRVEPGELRRQLFDRRHQLLSQVARGEADLLALATNVEPELLEEGQEQALAWLVERLDEHDRAEIDAIERALRRLDTGEYGICRGCGKPIPPDRQQALPFAELCLPCATEHEALDKERAGRH